MNLNSLLICGFRLEKREDWQSHVPEPKRDKRYGDDKWQTEKLPEAWAKLEAEAHEGLVTGRVVEAVVLDADGETHYAGDAVGFVTHLVQSVQPETETFLFSIDASKNLKRLLWTYVMDVPDATPVPPWLWIASSDTQYRFRNMAIPEIQLIDPATIAGTNTNKIAWPYWLKAWGCKPWTGGDVWTARHTAEVTFRIAQKMGFVTT